MTVNHSITSRITKPFRRSWSGRGTVVCDYRNRTKNGEVVKSKNGEIERERERKGGSKKRKKKPGENEARMKWKGHHHLRRSILSTPLATAIFPCQEMIFFTFPLSLLQSVLLFQERMEGGRRGGGIAGRFLRAFYVCPPGRRFGDEISRAARVRATHSSTPDREGKTKKKQKKGQSGVR